MNNISDKVCELPVGTKILINGITFILKQSELYYDDIVILAKKNPNVLQTVTYTVGRENGHLDGSLVPGQSLKIEDGMKFNVIYTGNA